MIGQLLIWGGFITWLVGGCAYYLGRPDRLGWAILGGLLGLAIGAVVKVQAKQRALKHASELLRSAQIGLLLPSTSPNPPRQLDYVVNTAGASTGPNLVVGNPVTEDEHALLVGAGVKDGEVINRGGEKVSPNNIEKALVLHPCVREAAAFGVPHPRLGENIAAAVTLQPGATTTPLELQKFLRGHLANFKIPQRIDIVASLLKSHDGKVLKAQLAESVINSEHRIDPPEKLLEFPILKIWQRLLQRDDIGIHDDFFEAGGDSLLWTQMILEVEELSKHRFSNSDVAEAVTIRQLAAITAVDLRGGDELVTKAKDGSRQPLFFCHGDYETHGFYALNFAALLEPDQPVYLVNPLVDVTDRSELVIEDMARPYVPRLLVV